MRDVSVVRRLRLGPAVFRTLSSGGCYIIPRGGRGLFQDAGRGHDFQVIVLTPAGCGELIFFFTCSYESDFKLTLPVPVCSLEVYSMRVCVCVCVLVLSVPDKCEETRTCRLQRGPF